MHDPLIISSSATPDDPQLLLLWAVRVRESGHRALAEAAALTRALEHRALQGMAGDALGELGAAVALGVRDTGRTALEAADQLTRAAHRAQQALDDARAAAAQSPATGRTPRR